MRAMRAMRAMSNRPRRNKEILSAIKARYPSWYLAQRRLVLDPMVGKVYAVEKKRLKG